MIVRMSSAQITAFQPRTTPLLAIPQHSHALNPSTLSFPFSVKTKLKLKCSYRSSSIICSSTSGAASDSDSQGPPWKAFEKALGNITKGQSIEEVLKQQIQKKEYFSGGNGGSGNGGGGGGGDSSGGLGEPEDDGLQGILDETIQVLLATAGFIFLYIYIINGEEMQKIARDYIIYMFKGTESVRLKRVKTQLKNFLDYFKLVEEEDDPYWLEREMINARTVYDGPEKYRKLFGSIADVTLSDPTQSTYSDPEPEGGGETDAEEDDDNDNDNDIDDDEF